MKNKLLTIVTAVSLWELSWWIRRRILRGQVYRQAAADALASNRPLVVIGAPDRGPTSGYGCGDVTIDAAGSSCPNTLTADITKPLPFKDDSVVVFVSCVLEYVDDFDAALSEIRRVGGSHVWIVRVEPWTLTAQLYPGRRRTLPASLLRT